MNLAEILKEVDTRTPNSLSIDQKISWINQVQNQLYRDYPFPEAIFPFIVEPKDINVYPLPDDCPEDRISHVMIDSDKYDFISQGNTLDTEPERFCTILTGALLIYPVEKHSIAYLHYRPRPGQLTSSNLSVVPNFPTDYHELLILGCAARVAKSEPSLSQFVSILDQDFHILMMRADRDLKKKRKNRVTKTRIWT